MSRRRVLIIRPGAIGDTIVTLPAIEALAASADYLEAWAPQNNLPLFRFAHATDSIAATGLDGLGLPDLAPPPRLLERLRGFDEIHSWYGASRDEFRTALAAVHPRVRFFPALPPHPAAQHAVDFFLEQAGFPQLAGAHPRIAVPAPHPRRPAIVIHPFSGSPRKNWPLDRYRELAHSLPLPVEWCAGPTEPLPEAVRFDNLHDLARWLAGASLYLGNDSGISHLAASVGTPVVAIFTRMDPRVWAPRGPRVRIVQDPDPPLTAVLAACRAMLEER